jgi:hypothetical protein
MCAAKNGGSNPVESDAELTAVGEEEKWVESKSSCQQSDHR